MTQSIMISGISGFLGSHLAQRLTVASARSADYAVSGIDLIHPDAAWRIPAATRRALAGYTWGSVEDACRSLPPVDALVHCAAVTDVAYASRSPAQASRITLDGTIAVAQAARRGWTKAVVLISSHSVYGPHHDAREPLTERAIPRPSNGYGALKLCQEAILTAAAQEFGFPLVVLRMSLMYGPREREGALVSAFVRRALSGETIQLHGGGHQTRDFNHVANATQGIQLALNLALDADNPPGRVQVFNICSGESTSIRELAEAAVAFARSGSIEDAPARAGEEGSIRLSHQAATDALGYTPLVSFREGFGQTAKWVADRWERQKREAE